MQKACGGIQYSRDKGTSGLILLNYYVLNEGQIVSMVPTLRGE